MKGPGHVLVIGVDGVRFDLLGPDGTPSIWELGQHGFLAPVPVDETTPTWSGPCWATIATGTGVAGHAITGNDLTGHRLADYPDFVTLATRAGLFGLAVVLTSLYPGVTVLLARLVLGERMSVARWAGLALATGGILLVSV